MPEVRLEGPLPLEAALARRRSVRAFGAEPLTSAELAQLLWSAQGVTGPDGSRSAPSAGALYPLELYVVTGDVTGLEPGVYRYQPGRHSLVEVGTGDARSVLADAAARQEWLAEAPVTIAIGAVEDRTSRKYGERAGRYVAIEAGHAAQALALQAVALGLGSTMVGAFDDDEVRRLLRAPRSTAFLLLVPVGRPR